MSCFPVGFGMANRKSKGLKLLPFPQQPMSLCRFALSWTPMGPHPKRESCVITPSSTLTQTLPPQWFTLVLPPAFSGTASWNPSQNQPLAWGARRAAVPTSSLLPRLPAPNDSCRLYLSQVCTWHLTLKRGGGGETSFLLGKISPPLAILKVLQSLESHLHTFLSQTSP